MVKENRFRSRMGLLALALLVCIGFSTLRSFDNGPQTTPSWRDQKTLHARKIMSIGSDDLDKPEYFLGFIADVYVDTHDNVFILDARNYLAREYSSDGKFIRSFGKGKGQGPGEFQFVCDVCADAAGHVYISDLYARRIVAFGRPDEPSRSFSTIDSGPIFDMDVDRDSKLYVGVHPKYIAARSWKGGIYQIYRTQDGALIGSIGKGWVGEAAQYHI